MASQERDNWLVPGRINAVPCCIDFFLVFLKIIENFRKSAIDKVASLFCLCLRTTACFIVILAFLLLITNTLLWSRPNIGFIVNYIGVCVELFMPYSKIIGNFSPGVYGELFYVG